MIKVYVDLIKRSWNDARSYLIATFFKNVFSALIPLVNICGLGYIVAGLVDGCAQRILIARIVIYVSINLMISLMRHILALAENKAMRKASNHLQIGYMQDAVDVDYHYAQNSTLGTLKRKSMSARPAFFLGLWGNFLECVIKLVGCLVTFFAVAPLFGPVVIATSIVIIYLNIWCMAKEYEYNIGKTDDDRKMDYLYMIMTDYKYAKEIRVNNAKSYIETKYKRILNRQLQSIKKLMNQKNEADVVASLLSATQAVSIYLLGTYLVFTDKISIAEYTVLIATTTLFASSFVQTFSLGGTIKKNASAREFLKEYDNILKDNSDKNRSYSATREDINLSDSDICFEHVSFVYPDSNKEILSDVSFTIRAHSKVCLVGLNGAGKSTIVMLLLRIYKPTKGRILIGGIDISTLDPKVYLKKLGVVLQDFSLFSYSITENLVFNETINEKRINEAIETSGLSEKISGLKKGLDTTLGKEIDPEGVEFSGGEAQRIALARAIYKAGDIVVLDEPTSAFDPIAEERFFGSLMDLSMGKTTVFVSHRLSSAIACDEIIVVDKGKVVERGTHDELIRNGKKYSELFNLQASLYKKACEVRL